MPLPERGPVMYAAGIQAGEASANAKRAPQIVSALPETGRVGVLYLVPNGGAPPNIYDEYIWIPGDEGGSYELMGEREIDLSRYVQDTRKVGNVPLSADIPVSLTGDSTIPVTNTGTASAIGYSVTHANSGVTAGSKGDTSNRIPAFGETFKTLHVTVDEKGHVTSIDDNTVKVPNTTATQSVAGLMSIEDKTKLDTIIDATLSNAGRAADAKAAGDAFAALRNYIASMDVYRNASGNPATFVDGIAINLKEIRVTITPTQSGSGDPSPTNIRPISGVSSVSVTRTGTGGANSQSVTVSLVDSNSDPLTVYGGTLNVTAGTLSVTHKCVALTSSSYSWIKSSNTSIRAGRAGFYIAGGIVDCVYSGGDTNPNNVQMLFSHAKSGMSAIDAVTATEFSIGVGMAGPANSTVWINIDAATANTVDEFKAWLDAQNSAGTPVQVVYPLAAPVTYTLTPAQLATLSGYNAVYSDAGTVDVIYKADTSITFGGA